MCIDWKHLISTTYSALGVFEPDVKPRYFLPATEAVLAAAEFSLECSIPPELRSLLAQSDGVMEQLVLPSGPIDASWCVWSTSELVASNLAIRSACSEATPLWPASSVFFVNAGVDGIQLGLLPRRDDLGDCLVFAWHPSENRIVRFETSLEGFLPRWIGGMVKV